MTDQPTRGPETTTPASPGIALPNAGGDAGTCEPCYLAGYAAALGCAFVGSGCPVSSRSGGNVPTGVAAGRCALAALLALPDRASPLTKM